MKFAKTLLAGLGLILPASAIEIYFAGTTPAEVASVHELQAPIQSTDAQYKIEMVIGIALAGPQGETAITGGGIRLTESAISPTTASALGYPTYKQEALGSALVAIQGAGSAPARTTGASEYRYGLGQGGGNALWNIQFDGVPEYNSGAQNFFRNKLDDAVASARTAIRANPFQKGAGSGYAYIFQAAYEATVPYTYAGNEWRAKAERERIGVTPALASPTARMAALETASARFRQATEAFIAFMNHPVESAWMLDPDSVLDGAGPAWAGGLSWAELLYESYAEALTRFADSRFEYFYTRYLSEYQPPGTGNTAMTALRAEIETSAAEIDHLVLPLAALSSRGVIPPTLDIHAPSSRAQLLRRLAEHVQERALFFSAGENPFASHRTVFRTYGANFVPFLTPANLASRPFTFDNLLEFIYGIQGTTIAPIGTGPLSNTLIGQAIQAETTASAKLDEVLSNVQQLTNLKAETQQKYTADLKQLCGVRRANPVNPGEGTVPDILTYLAPPEERPAMMSDESEGDIGLSWRRIEQAETRLFSAYRALAEIDEEADIIRGYGDERLKSYQEIARIQIRAGEEIGALDYLSGEIRANAILAEASEREKQAKKRSWFKSIAGVVIRAAAAYATAGASEIAYAQSWAATTEIAAGAIGLSDQISSSESQAEMHRNIGNIQADAARRDGEINAQRTKIRAMEAAGITMQQATQEENRILEAIYKLMIRVERQKLEILLAQQALDYAEMEHANLIARIGTILEEYRRVSIRQANLLLNRPDVRLVRDFEIMEANRRFRVAQEYAFLLARSADYRFAGRTNSPFRSRIRSEIQEILKAQNATQIKDAVDELINIRGEFFAGPAASNQLSGLLEVRFSIRDLVAQSNSRFAIFSRNVNGEVDNALGYFPGDLQPYPQSIAPLADTVPELSEAQFADFLTARLLPVPNTTEESILRIPFAIGMEPTRDLRANPLRQEATNLFYGMVIEGPGPSYISSSAVGVFANVRLRRNINPNVFANTATLTPVGSYSVSRLPAAGATAAIEPENIDVWSPAEMSMQRQSAPIRILKNRDTLTTGWKSRFESDLSLNNNGFHLHERSPVNDHWLLEIQMTNSQWNILMGNILDIELCMTLRAWK